jgi:UDP-perosamine 4-acetyltransferase
MSAVVVYGAGGHAKVVADSLLAAGREVLGFVDDDPTRAGSLVLGLPVHTRDWLRERVSAGGVSVALGIGDNAARQAIAHRIREMGASLCIAAHPTAVIAASARVGEGTVLMAGAIVNADAVIGVGAIVNTSAVVEHDVVVGDFAHLSPGAVLAGASALGTLSSLGAGAVVIHCVAVGAGTVVGAGAVVSRPLPDHVVAYGVPARVHRQLPGSGG